MKHKLGFTTRSLHADPHDKPHRAHVMPIFQTSSFGFDDAEQGAEIFAGREKGYIYTRMGNPTTTALEQVLASLEGGDLAVAFSSGLAAISAAILAHCRAGDHVICSGAMYGPSVKIVNEILPRFGIASTVIDPTIPGAFESSIRPKTKAFLFETPANPTMAIVDIAETVRIAHARNVLVIVDNTFCSPYLQRPLELGADIVVHSGTKYLNGHADVICGFAVANETLAKPIWAYRKDMGACLSPFDSFLVLRGLRTLSLRMERHCSNAEAIVKMLQSHPAIDKVHYPGLSSHPGHEVACKQMHGFGGMVAFEMKGGYDAAVKMLNNLHVITLVISLGTVDTIISHPASMTHSGLPRHIREEQGITDGLVRISVGIEDVEDLIADLTNALSQL